MSVIQLGAARQHPFRVCKHTTWVLVRVMLVRNHDVARVCVYVYRVHSVQTYLLC